MPWNPGLTQLRDLLADLYPTIQLSREVLEQASLPTGHITFSAAAISNWHEILKYADRRRQVPAVVAVARREFPERSTELIAAEQAYLGHAGRAAAPPSAGLGTDTPSSTPHHGTHIPDASMAYRGELRLGVVRELLLAAFTPEDLVRLFRYTSNSALHPVVNQFGPADGLATLADKAITYCDKRGLLPDLLAEVQRENPRQYARYESRLWDGGAGAS